MPAATTTFDCVDDLVAHLRELAALGSDEGLAFSELDHGLQTAAILESTHPDDLELQAAGLVHDLAHPWDGPGQPEHHRMGARAVEGLLGERVAFLIEAHVDAKRYLVATDAGYQAALSPGSVVTLEAQGGPLSPEEILLVEQRPDWDAAVALRRADDGAKIAGAVVADLDHWIPALHEMAGR
ncbi:MAG TPA: HD domain-containing protein [Ilumatobacteraceae bacterium]|nr:HD domain-containing protein [Ilumatobacteraceae bacterium]